MDDNVVSEILIEPVQSFEDGMNKLVNEGASRVSFEGLPLSQDESLLLFSEILKDNNTCTMLCLRSTNLDDLGAMALANAIGENNTLTHLDVAQNCLSDDGVAAIAVALRKNRSLLVLDVEDNRHTQSGVQALTQVLKINKTIVNIRASQNSHGYTSTVSTNELVHVLSENKIYREQTTKPLFEKEFKDILQYGDAGPWKRAKLMVVGEGRAGKTATVRSLIGRPFKKKIKSTVGAAINESRIYNLLDQNYDHGNVLSWKDLNDQGQAFGDAAPNDFISRTAGILATERVRSVVNQRKNKKPKYYRFNRAASIRDQLDDVNKSADTTSEKQASSKTVGEGLRNVFTFFSQKTGSARRLVRDQSSKKFNIGKKAVRKDKALLFSDDEMTQRLGKYRRFDGDIDLDGMHELNSSIDVSIWDYGGQKVFYTMHHLFLTEYGVYLLVFNLKDMVGKRAEQTLEYLDFWLSSIKLHAPSAPVVIVGTFYENTGLLNIGKSKSNIDLKSLNFILEKKLDLRVRFPQIIRNEVLTRNLSFFPISNKTGYGVAALQTLLGEVICTQEYVNRKVPLSWMRCLELMDAEAGSKTTSSNYISFDQVREIGTTLDIDARGIEEMLAFFHELGVVVHFTDTVALQSVVTLNSQWLIDNLARIIRDDQYHKFSKSERAEIEKLGLVEDVKRMYDHALVSQDLVDYLFGKSRDKAHFFLDFARRMLLISDWKFGDQQELLYLVPSLLQQPAFKTSRIKRAWKPKIWGYKNAKEEATEVTTNVSFLLKFGIACVLDFGETLPVGIYERIMCIAVGMSSKDENSRPPILKASSADIWFGPKSFFHMEKGQKTIQIYALPEDNSAHRYVHMFRSILHKVESSLFEGRAIAEIRFQTPGEALEECYSFEEAKKKAVKPWFVTNEPPVGEMISEKHIESFIGNL